MTRDRLSQWLDSPRVRNAIIAVIIVNAVLLGMETSPTLMAAAGPVIVTLDRICLGIFVLELALKLYALGWRFFRSGWNIFDFVIVGISLVPGAQTLSVLRALRILRLLRVISVMPRLRRVVEGFVSALPGMASVFVLMGMVFYIGSVMATKLFAASFPEWFGSLPASAYSLFQIMTLESWSMGIVRPVMEVYPYAWAFFVPFILLTTFAVVNLLVGLIVNSMQDAHSEESTAATDAYRDEVLDRLKAIEERLAEREVDSVPRKARLDLIYQRNRSLRPDLGLIAWTAARFIPRGLRPRRKGRPL
jgi:voltage-gated sodium channel